MFLSPSGTTSSFTESYSRLPGEHYFWIWYYIEIINLEEGEIFPYSNGKWNANVHNTAEFLYQHKKVQTTSDTEKLMGTDWWKADQTGVMHFQGPDLAAKVCLTHHDEKRFEEGMFCVELNL